MAKQCGHAVDMSLIFSRMFVCVLEFYANDSVDWK